MGKFSKGFVTVVVLIVVVLVVSGIYIFVKEEDVSKNNTTPSVSELVGNTSNKITITPGLTSGSMANWGTYVNPIVGYEIKHPPNWEIINAQTDAQGNINPEARRIIIRTNQSNLGDINIEERGYVPTNDGYVPLETDKTFNSINFKCNPEAFQEGFNTVCWTPIPRSENYLFVSVDDTNTTVLQILSTFQFTTKN